MFARAVGRAVEELGPGPVRALARGIDRGADDTALRAASARPGFAEIVTGLRAAQRAEAVEDRLAAAYLSGVADGHERSAAGERVETVCSGPTRHAVPVRSTAAVLLGLIDGARHDLLLTTYSARPYAPVQDALRRAGARDVRIRVVVETLQGAGSALTDVQPAAAFRGIPGLQLWHWPVEHRPDGSARMHAKIVVGDAAVLLVSSTNLTRSGIEQNIESGILVHGGSTPRRAVEHIDGMIADGVLEPLRTEDR
ncbi:DISARM system phospholipase D-like protein DrmC [Pseudonocardia alni]|uniref:DISARM system phospholipase D-like protein DrmC n=1 Tax=Pseudonocardia alni TaxID=33907 RepID=UPI001FCC2D99|nr:DISARM system phospholipase D-like protein DrmC [Pseudonocardia alni]MBO4238582.1 endonuclease [Pseudonocardia alni]